MTADYNDKERVPDAKLNQLLQIFDTINLSNEGLEKPDILGDAYMYLLKKFADDGGKFLINALEYVKAQGGNHKNVQVYIRSRYLV